MSTNNYIFNFSVEDENKEQIKYASHFRRTLANIIDIHIVLIIRAIFIQVIYSTIFANVIKNFIDDFDLKFGTRTPKSTPEHLDYIMHHPILIYSIILILITFFLGAFYYAYFNSSNWQATIGKRLMGVIISSNNSKITFLTALSHYFLSITPYIFVIFLIYYTKRYNYNLYELFNEKKSIAIVGISFIFASNFGIFNKKRLNFFDFLTKVEHHRCKTNFKFPSH